MSKEINKIISILEEGGVILYPTDTVWGLGCDATNTTAIQKIYKIKKREVNKPLILLIHDSKRLSNYIKSVPEIANQMIKEVKEPITIIYEQPINLPELLTSNKTIGIRVVKQNHLKLLLKTFNKPITSTSANISNSKNPISFSEIDRYIKNNVDYIVSESFMCYKSKNKASKIIKITNNSNIQIIRK